MESGSLLAFTIVGCVAFASTNVDDLLMLVAFYSDLHLRPWQIAAGQFLGIGTLVSASLICASIAMVIPQPYRSFLGILPILVGIMHLLRCRPEPGREANNGSGRAPGGIFSVAAVTASNGSDNIAVYTPLLAGKTVIEVIGFAAIFAIMTTVWLAAARLLVTHSRIGPPIQLIGRVLFPWVLIALGGYILLSESGAHCKILQWMIGA
jgi:cadmium resistance protein CadD (predicted permease)